MSTITYNVPEISCGHCVESITREVSIVHGVQEIQVDLTGKTVAVHGEDLDDNAIRAAIDEAGYEVA